MENFGYMVSETKKMKMRLFDTDGKDHRLEIERDNPIGESRNPSESKERF
jgi:hypothetical protein